MKKAVGRVVARLTAGVSVAMLHCYAGKESSIVLPSMSATAATAVRRSATARSAARRGMATTTATGSGTSATTETRASATATAVARSRASATTVGAAIAVIRTAVRARSNDRLPHVELRTRRSAVAPGLWTVAAACGTRTAGRAVGTAGRCVRTAVLRATHGWACGRPTAG